MKTETKVQTETKARRTIDVIIPAYKPGKKFSRLLTMLEKQTYPIGKIIVMNTEEKFWNKNGYEGIPNLEVHHIRKEEFDHGGTRHRAVSCSGADVFLCMTDDAVPADNHLIENLMAGFDKRGPEGERPAMVYARQLPDRDCGYAEKYTRHFNYPDESRVKTKADLPELGIKTYFGSNVCCAYDREIYDRQGGFIRHTIFNEDMIFAGHAIQDGYGVVYQADARVIHSHNYGCMQQFHRNFDLAVSQADHPEIFKGVPSEGEGIRLVKRTALYLVKSGHPWLLPALVVKSGFKYLGYLLGKRYRKLPKKMVLWCSMNQNYWKKAENNL
ncbi:MAG: glycosyltransferase [Lachnospiraceae bacterium]|nr:glycosyltransferase [Lachnospiraceae bacterium]